MKDLFSIPEYPCKSDMWDELAAQSRPIVVYGMGNGADKLIRRFEKYGIEIADFFASDGFVRGHSFHGKLVKSFSEIKAEYKDFVIVLSFASNRDDVVDMLAAIDREYDMYVPDMPVAGEDEYFDKDFYNAHYTEIVKAYNLLSDPKSREIYAATLNYKLFGRMKFLLNSVNTRDEMYSVMPCEKIENSIDAGAYNGDTVREIKEYFKNLKNVIAVEPDNRNFKKLQKYSEAENNICVDAYHCAAWNCNEKGSFIDSGNRNSSVSSTASFEHKDTQVSLVRLDSLTEGKIDYIKYDVEGGELEAIEGSEKIISQHRPTLLVSVYHRSRDLFFLINYMSEKYPFYRMYLRRLKCVPAWELNLILVTE